MSNGLNNPVPDNFSSPVRYPRDATVDNEPVQPEDGGISRTRAGYTSERLHW
jgi:hypothetical protein